MCNQDARAPLGRCRLLLTSTPCRGSCAFAWLWQPSITKDVLPVSATLKHFLFRIRLGRIPIARLAQSAERKALNLVVVGSSPTVGVLCGSPRPGALGNAETMIHSRVIGMGGRGGGTGIGQVLPGRCNTISKSKWKDASVPSMLGFILAWIWSACRVRKA
jgi:hypothetical protein